MIEQPTLFDVPPKNAQTKTTQTKTTQTKTAQAKGVSNCPMCAAGRGSRAKKIYGYNEMDADHVTAWSKGGETTAANCQMLCKAHNRVKGNA